MDISLAKLAPAGLPAVSVTWRFISFAVTEPLLVMVISSAGLMNVDGTFVKGANVMLGVSYPDATLFAVNTRLSVPAEIDWVLVVLAVNVADAPAPIKAMAATPSPPRTAIVLSFMMSYLLLSLCLSGVWSGRMYRCVT